MAKSSRWLDWVKAESATARVPLPWTLNRRIRQRRAVFNARQQGQGLGG